MWSNTSYKSERQKLAEQNTCSKPASMSDKMTSICRTMATVTPHSRSVHVQAMGAGAGNDGLRGASEETLRWHADARNLLRRCAATPDCGRAGVIQTEAQYGDESFFLNHVSSSV